MKSTLFNLGTLIILSLVLFSCAKDNNIRKDNKIGLDPIGVFLANHEQATGIEEWKIDRWKREIGDMKKMGAQTIWYLPIQFGQRSKKDFEVNSEFWTLQKDICKALIAEKMEVGIYIGYNDIFPETFNEHPEWAALHGKYGMEAAHVCPSNDDAKNQIMLLRKKVFQELPRIDYLISPITDYGGCSCEKCAPLPNTYIRILKELADSCRKYHPAVKIVAAGHVVNLAEGDMLRKLIKDAEWIDMVADIPRGVKPVIKYYMYPEITMINGWGAYGPTPRIKDIKNAYSNDYKNISGSVNYSEGIHDDINRFAALKFAQNPDRSAYEVAFEYAHDWLKLDEQNAKVVAEIILGLGTDIPRNRDYAGYNDGVTNPLADQRLKTLIEIRNKNSFICNNYRYWLLTYRAIYECFATNDGELSVEKLDSELLYVRAELTRLEPEYGKYLNSISIYKRPEMCPWNWPRTFNAAFRRENSF